MPDGTSTTPLLGISRDRIYPRCVWCRGENYALAVLAYSAGEIPCAAVRGCGRFLPVGYRRIEPVEATEPEPPCFGAALADPTDREEPPIERTEPGGR